MTDLICKKDEHNITYVISKEQVDLPHIKVIYQLQYGSALVGVCAVKSSESFEQAANKAFPDSVFDKKRTFHLIKWSE
jgi:hypothetical protein